VIFCHSEDNKHIPVTIQFYDEQLKVTLNTYHMSGDELVVDPAHETVCTIEYANPRIVEEVIDLVQNHKVLERKCK